MILAFLTQGRLGILEEKSIKKKKFYKLKLAYALTNSENLFRIIYLNFYF